MTRTLAQSVNSQTRLCISLSGRPSNIGTRFHNYLYDELGLDYVYKAFTTADLNAAITGIRGLGIRGCGVSMPFKQDCIALVDEMHDSARAIRSVNTIVNEDGVLHAYNTDYAAIVSLLTSHRVDRSLPVAVAGSGAMATAVVAALRNSGFTDGTVVARNEGTGAALAEQYGFAWQQSIEPGRAGLLVNATPIGMAGGPGSAELAFPAAAICGARVVFDVVAMPSQTPLIRLARELGTPVITGAEVIALQALEQFVLYTGIRPTPDQMWRASEFSRG